VDDGVEGGECEELVMLTMKYRKRIQTARKKILMVIYKWRI
jgi:hypothetical protein